MNEINEVPYLLDAVAALNRACCAITSGDSLGRAWSCHGDGLRDGGLSTADIEGYGCGCGGRKNDESKGGDGGDARQHGY